jgi:PBP1b-binding outer membrane lipoprotein LpoB
MEFNKLNLKSILLVLFSALVLTGCTQVEVDNTQIDKMQDEVIEVTSEDIIEDVVVEDVEEDVELGELI